MFFPPSRPQYYTLFLLGIFALFSTLRAQEPSYRAFGTQQGLINDNVYYSFQDNQGFIWFGTEAGLSRFDGREFENFTTKDGLSDNEILSIYQDSQNRIWFLTYSGAPTYWLDGSFYTASNDTMLANWPLTTFLSSVAEDESGDLWFSSDISGILMLTKDGRKIHYQGDKLLKTKKIYPTGNGSYVAINFHSINIFSIENEGLEIKQDTITKEGNMRVTSTQSGSILLFNAFKVNELAPSSHQLTTFPFEVPWTRQVIYCGEDSKSDVWVGTWDGVYRIFGGKFETGNYDHFLPGTAITSVLIDHEGNYWFTTLGKGVFTMPSADLQTYTEAEGFPSNQITALRLDPSGRVTIGFPENNYGFLDDDGFSIHTLPECHTRDLINDFAWDESGNLWIGGDTYLGLHRKNGNDWARFGAKCMLKDSKGNLWVGGPGRLVLFRINPFKAPFYHRGRLLIQFNKESPYASFVTSLTTFSLLEDQKGRLFAGTTRGLYQIENDSLIPFHHEFTELRTRVQDLAETQEGYIVAGTYGQGVVVIKPDTVLFWDGESGLAGDICYRVVVDEANQIWVGTDNGMTKITQEAENKYVFQTFSQQDGLASKVVNDLLVEEDKVWVGTPNGLSVVDRAQFDTPLALPFIYLTQMSAGDSLIDLGTSANIPYRDRDLTFSFRGIHFRSPEKLGYRYRLVGYDDGWRTTQNSEVNYLKVPPGAFRFEVQAVLPGEIMSSEPAAVEFIIQTPFWQQPWVITVAILLFLALLGLIFILALKQIKKRERRRAEVEQKIAASELKALQAQMNPHFIFNTLNSIQRFILKEDSDAAYYHMERFAALMRMILENSKRKYISLETEFETLKLYVELEALRFEKQFSYHLELAPELTSTEIQLPPMLLQPYVENAILHGLNPKEAPGNLDIKFELESQHLKVSIEDDGIGREEAKKLKGKLRERRKSTGLANTADRITQLNVNQTSFYTIQIIDLKDQQQLATGTRVEVRIPLAQHKTS